MSQANTLFTSALLASPALESNDLDMLGNPVVPYFQFDWEAADGQWADAHQSNSSVSSLFGLPMIPGWRNQCDEEKAPCNLTFTAEIAYIEASCAAPTETTVRESALLNDTALRLCGEYRYNDIDTTLAQCSLPANGSYYGYQLKDRFSSPGNVTSPWNLGLDTFIDQYWMDYLDYVMRSYYRSSEPPLMETINNPNLRLFANESGIETSPGTLRLQYSYIRDNSPFSMTYEDDDPIHELYCQLAYRCDEIRVACRGVTGAECPGDMYDYCDPVCRVAAVRPSQKQNTPPDITPLSFPIVFDYFSKALPTASGMGASDRTKSLVLQYLVGGTETYRGVGNGVGRPGDYNSLDEVPLENLNVRLSHVLNTYLAVGWVDVYEQSTKYAPWVGNIIREPLEARSVVNPISTWTYNEERFKVSVAWMCVFLVSVAGMFAASVVSAFVFGRAIIPDIIGYASTLVRDSPYVDLPPGAARLDGMELTKAMREEVVRYGPVAQLAESGNAALLGVGLAREVERVDGKTKYA